MTVTVWTRISNYKPDGSYTFEGRNLVVVKLESEHDVTFRVNKLVILGLLDVSDANVTIEADAFYHVGMICGKNVTIHTQHLYLNKNNDKKLIKEINSLRLGVDIKQIDTNKSGKIKAINVTFLPYKKP